MAVTDDYIGNRRSPDGGVYANELRREDPWVRSRVREVLEERQELIESMEPYIRALEEIVHKLPYSTVNDTSIRLDSRVSNAVWNLRREHSSRGRGLSEAYVGNAAAFELGDAIVRREEKPS